MNDWNVGDLAVCVELSPRSRFGLGALKVGATYTVTRVFLSAYGSHCVALAEVRSDHPDGGYQSFRFRKVVKDEATACETEFVTLLKRSRVPLRAGIVRDLIFTMGRVAR